MIGLSAIILLLTMLNLTKSLPNLTPLLTRVALPPNEISQYSSPLSVRGVSHLKPSKDNDNLYFSKLSCVGGKIISYSLLAISLYSSIEVIVVVIELIRTSVAIKLVSKLLNKLRKVALICNFPLTILA